MEQQKYQGYAQDRGFNPIQLSTASVDAIGQQSNAMLRQMRENQDAESRNRNAFQNQVERNQSLEAQNRSSNRQFENQSAEGYAQAMAINSRVNINNAQNNAQLIDKNFGALAGLSNTIAKAVLDVKKQRDETQGLAAQNLIFESGITYEDYVGLKSEEAKLDGAATNINSVANRLKAQGMSEETLTQIRSLSGARLYGASKQWAMQGADGYASFRADYAQTPIEINGRQTTLAQAAKGSPEDYKLANAYVRSEYLKRYQGLSSAFANEYLYDGMRKQEVKERLLFSENRSKELEKDQASTESNDLLGRLKSAGGQGVLDWINIQAGGDPKELGEKRRDALSYLIAQAEVGLFDGEKLTQLEDTTFIPNGESKPVRFGDRFATDLKELRKSVVSFNSEKRQQQAQQTEDEQKDLEARLNDRIATSGPPTKAEVKLAIDYWRSRGWGSPPPWLQGLDTIEELSQELGDARLLQLKVDGMLTTKELNSGRYNNTLRDKYSKDAKAQGSVSQDTKTFRFKELDLALANTLNTVDPKGASKNPDLIAAQIEMRRMLSQRASNLIDKTGNPEEAWDQATLELRKEIEAGAKGTGRFAVRLQTDGKTPDFIKPGFQIAGQGTSALAQAKRAAQIKSELNVNSKLLYDKLYLNQTELEQLEGYRDGVGTIPPVIWAMSSAVKNHTVFDIADAQLKKAKKSPIQRPPSARLYDEVDPAFRQLLTWRPSIDRTMRALDAGSGGAPGNPYRPVLDLIASRESSNDTKFNGYDAMNKGGTNNGHTAISSGTGFKFFGKPLLQMSVGEVLALGRGGKIFAAGRYQFIPETLQGLVDRGKASTGELFNEQTQDKLAVAMLREQTGQFWSGRTSAGSYVNGLGHTWIGLQKVKPAQIVAAMEQAKLNLSNPNIDTSRLRPQVAYRVGNIGPTSTGPHLHVGDTTGAFYKRNALDNFVAFKLPTGIVPLSAGTTIKGGEFGALRDYGSHSGRDYAVPLDTPVILRNGARVISKKSSEHGDVLTIATPDGRRFTFLHGTAS
jgi:muramidase (phage lysozyme)